MTIGATIKMLRRRQDITQERLAEMLNLSASAISQWETDRVMPDVMQIPILANIFNVSADVILGIDVERKNEKIKEILKNAEGMMYNSEWQKAVDFLRGQHRLYPREYQITEMLADALVNDYSRRNINAYAEVIALCKPVLAECSDNAIRCKALDTLGTAYSYAGKRDELLKTAEQMSAFRFSKEQFLLWRMQGEEGLKQRREYLTALIEQIASVLSLLAWHRHDSGEYMYSKKDRVRLLKQLVGLIELLYPDGDYQIKAQHAEIACSVLAQGYFTDGNEDGGFHGWKRPATMRSALTPMIPTLPIRHPRLGDTAAAVGLWKTVVTIPPAFSTV